MKTIVSAPLDRAQSTKYILICVVKPRLSNLGPVPPALVIIASPLSMMWPTPNAVYNTDGRQIKLRFI